jgi:hypothetical protein
VFPVLVILLISLINKTSSFRNGSLTKHTPLSSFTKAFKSLNSNCRKIVSCDTIKK